MEIMLCLQRNVVVYFSTHVCVMKLLCNDHKNNYLHWNIVIAFLLWSSNIFSVDQAKVSAQSIHHRTGFSKWIWNWIIYKHPYASFQIEYYYSSTMVYAPKYHGYYSNTMVNFLKGCLLRLYSVLKAWPQISAASKNL